MNYIFDLDGTLCFKGEPLSENILEALTSLETAGGKVLFASARPIRDMLPIIDKRFHRHILIGGNGSLISKNNQIIHSETFHETELNKIMQLIAKYEATYLIDDTWDYAYTGPSTHPILKNVDPAKLAKQRPFESLDQIIKILILSSNNPEQLEVDLAKLAIYLNKHKNEAVLDISPSGIHKWRALQTLGLLPNSYIAFGNDANDITMFQNSLHAIQVGENKALAPYATETVSLDEPAIISKIQAVGEMYR
ncbi:hypothetical protein IGI37_001975 [Enterococcus sp. AZ194]|uniref:HAD-IIB family hydrolase n=1 Tax=Enterococcus sp. AZ194 TaxID=2774629 RepID=UPI003F273DAF